MTYSQKSLLLFYDGSYSMRRYLGGKLRVKHDAKVASEAAVAAESADVTDNKTE